MRSGWLVMPVSITATTTPAPVALSQAGRTLIEALLVPKPHCSENRVSLGTRVACISWSTSTYSTLGSAARRRISSSASARSSGRSALTTVGPIASWRSFCSPSARPWAAGTAAAAALSELASAVGVATSVLPSLYFTMKR